MVRHRTHPINVTSVPLAYERLISELVDELTGLQARDMLRRLTPLEAVEGSTVTIGGRAFVCWCSNDYLGLSTDSRLIEAACEATRRWGVGARASRLLSGTTRVHQALEEDLARFFQAPACVVFSSGYLANLGALRVLADAGDLVLVDRLAHASLIDACRATGATLRVFRHNDPEHVARLLARRHNARRAVVVTEGLFSMDGDVAAVADLVAITREHDAVLYLDDAHGAFVLGASGRGTLELAGVDPGALLLMGTLGKALGCQGGFLVGPQALIDAIHNHARTFLYSTALATPVAAAASCALRIVSTDPTPRRTLTARVNELHDRLHGLVNPPRAARTQIIPVLLGALERAVACSNALAARGIFAPAIRPPTVPVGRARLRLSVTAHHTREQITVLCDALSSVLGGSFSA